MTLTYMRIMQIGTVNRFDFRLLAL